MTSERSHRRITWEQFARALKLFFGLGWATLELWLWGGRPYPLFFIGAVIAGTEGAQLWLRLRALVEAPSPAPSSEPSGPLPPP